MSINPKSLYDYFTRDTIQTAAATALSPQRTIETALSGWVDVDAIKSYADTAAGADIEVEEGGGRDDGGMDAGVGRGDKDDGGMSDDSPKNRLQKKIATQTDLRSKPGTLLQAFQTLAK
ncbi:hypothetical protein HK102_006181, partial [Quaeritorhiza haematococci]